MKKNKLLSAFLVALIATAVLHSIAEAKGLYFTIWWFDILTHFGGGATVGFGSLWFGCRIGLFPPAGVSETTMWGIRIIYEKGIPSWATCCVMLVGISIFAPVWELWEVIMRESFGLTWVGMPYPTEYVPDTLSDLMTGFSGAIIAWAVAHKVEWVVWKEPKENVQIAEQH